MILKGLDQAVRNMQKVRDSVRADELEIALEAGCQIIEAAARQRVPVRTGRLRDSLGHQTKEKRARAVTRVIGPNRDGFYGAFVEFGTRGRPPRPWLKPAYEASKAEAVRAVRDLLGSDILKVAARLKKR